jgi:hypothetical protein
MTTTNGNGTGKAPATVASNAPMTLAVWSLLEDAIIGTIRDVQTRAHERITSLEQRIAILEAERPRRSGKATK